MRHPSCGGVNCRVRFLLSFVETILAKTTSCLAIQKQRWSNIDHLPFLFFYDLHTPKTSNFHDDPSNESLLDAAKYLDMCAPLTGHTLIWWLIQATGSRYTTQQKDRIPYHCKFIIILCRCVHIYTDHELIRKTDISKHWWKVFMLMCSA